MLSSVLNTIIMTVYRFAIVPLALLLVLALACFNKKIRQGLKMRQAKGNKTPWEQLPRNLKPLWFHCSSGEFEYAKPVIATIKKQFPHTPILVTYFSPTYKNAIESFYAVDYSCPLPLDLPAPLSSLIKRLQPQAVMISRTDFWPEFLQQLNAFKTPVYAFSYTANPKTGLAARILRRWLLNKLSAIYCVSAADKKQLLALKIKPAIKVFGDSRYDQVFSRLESPNPIKESLFVNPPKNPVLIAGSTWLEDEKQLLPAVKDLIIEHRISLMLVPHEIDDSHIESIQSELHKLGLSYQKYSDSILWDSTHVLIVDRVGVLAELYQEGDIAFVGGSFKSSVHSVMEPLACGLPVVVGPHINNNREAQEFNRPLSERGIHYVSVARDSLQLRQIIEELLQAPLLEVKAEISQDLLQKKGASQRLAAEMTANLQ